MSSCYQDKGYELHFDELADLEAWEGYEFWSAQLEAQVDFLTDQECIQAAQVRCAEQSERGSDVLPF